MKIVSRIGQTHFAPPSKEELGQSGSSKQAGGLGNGPSIPPSLSTSALGDIGQNAAQYAGLPPEIKLRRQSLECLVAALKSLVAWSSSTGRSPAEDGPVNEDGLGRHHGQGSASGSNLEIATPTPSWPADPAVRASISGQPSTGANTPDIMEDDVDKFESAKQRKNTLVEGIKKFNFKPKRGVQYLIENGFIKSNSPQDVAKFLLGDHGLSKAMIGEYLGEG